MRRRQTTGQRGYGARHQALRKRLAPEVAAGNAICARCGKLILPGEPWDMGHVDGSRSEYAGAEHRACNRATAGRRRDMRDHPSPFRGPDGQPWSRQWF